MTITYTVTGMNEDQVSFTARQNGNMLDQATGKRDYEVTLNNRGNTNVELCWTKLDRKAKKINFLVLQNANQIDAKATTDTVEGLQSKIESLQNQLDQISNNIVSQREIEKEHYERKYNFTN